MKTVILMVVAFVVGGMVGAFVVLHHVATVTVPAAEEAIEQWKAAAARWQLIAMDSAMSCADPENNGNAVTSGPNSPANTGSTNKITIYSEEQ